MSAKENLHEGHRERLVNKFLKYPDSFTDHELLELLLFSYIPRKNTNDIAHNLIDSFGTLEDVFNASAQDLMLVKGVGKKTAFGIALNGKLHAELLNRKKPKPAHPWWRLVDYVEVIRAYFDSLDDEKLFVFFLDDNYELFYKMSFTDRDKSSVRFDITELSEMIALKKPRYIITAHNHPSGSATPSAEDDLSVKKLITLCNSLGCTLADNLIYGKTSCLSYRYDLHNEEIQHQAEYFNRIIQSE